MWIRRITLLLLLVSGLVQADPLRVVATGSGTGMLVRELAGDLAGLTVLAPPDRDPHRLQARPSMIRALRSADLVVALGAELEAGWLPVAIQGAANPRILPGRPGYFEIAAQVPLLEAGGVADRAMGDVHPVGNPHIDMDPLRMARAGLALAQRLGELDPAHADGYRARAAAFRERVKTRLAAWRERTAGAPGVLLYHRDAIYLLDRLGVPLLGVLEPVPGVPPSAAHLKELADGLTGRRGVVLSAVYQPPQAPESIAAALGWPAFRLPLAPPLEADGDAYLAHLDRWVEAIAAGRQP